jgi:hypothetical protein
MQWAPAPCFPNQVFAIAILSLSATSLTSILDQTSLVGPRLLNLGGHNGTFSETLVISGEGLEVGEVYRKFMVKALVVVRLEN